MLHLLPQVRFRPADIDLKHYRHRTSIVNMKMNKLFEVNVVQQANIGFVVFIGVIFYDTFKKYMHDNKQPNTITSNTHNDRKRMFAENHDIISLYHPYVMLLVLIMIQFSKYNLSY